VEVGIAVPDATSAQRLVQRLLNVFDAASISLADTGREVRVQAERTVNQTLIEALWVVSRWLDDGGVSSAEVRFGDRSYTLVASEERNRVRAEASS
jgi:hypothetical protein